MRKNIVDLEQRIKTLERKLNNTFARGELKGITNGKTAKAKVSLLEGEVNDGIEYPQQFGFISNPPAGSEVVVAFFGGNRDHGTIIGAFNKNHAPSDFAAGESGIYNASGAMVKVKASGDIEINSGGAAVTIAAGGEITITSTQVTITAPETTINGHLTVTDGITG